MRIGIVGSGYIAGAHSAAYRTVAGTYPDVPRDVQLVAAADVDRRRAAELAAGVGLAARATATGARSPGPTTSTSSTSACPTCSTPRSPAMRSPTASTSSARSRSPTTGTAARDMVAAADAADRVAQVCFYYRLWPAITLGPPADRRPASSGRSAHFRGWMLQDYAANPAHDLGWRARLGRVRCRRARRPRLAHHRHRPLTCAARSRGSAATTRELVDRDTADAGRRRPGVDARRLRERRRRRARGQLGAARPQVRPRLRPRVRARRGALLVGAVQRGRACSTGDVGRSR